MIPMKSRLKLSGTILRELQVLIFTIAVAVFENLLKVGALIGMNVKFSILQVFLSSAECIHIHKSDCECSFIKLYCL